MVHGASRPNSTWVSSRRFPNATPYFGHSELSARSCAAVIRPPRVTKERIERGYSVAVISGEDLTAWQARPRRDHGISARGAGGARGI